jgi:formamidopyrimidine-DNA glycosylase
MTVPLATGLRRDAGDCLLTAEEEDSLRAFCALVARRTPRGGELAWALRRFELGCERASAVEALTDWLLAGRALLADSETPGYDGMAERLAAICAGESRRLHSMLRDQRVIAGIGRAWANEILHHAQLSPYDLTRDVTPEQIERLADAIDTELSRGLELRERGANDKKTYRVHNHLGEPCYVCGTPIARVDFEEHTIYYCPECQTGGRVLKDRRLSRLLR